MSITTVTNSGGGLPPYSATLSPDELKPFLERGFNSLANVFAQIATARPAAKAFEDALNDAFEAPVVTQKRDGSPLSSQVSFARTESVSPDAISVPVIVRAVGAPSFRGLVLNIEKNPLEGGMSWALKTTDGREVLSSHSSQVDLTQLDKQSLDLEGRILQRIAEVCAAFTMPAEASGSAGVAVGVREQVAKAGGRDDGDSLR